MKDSIKQIELKVDRPPVWVTFVLAGMGAVLGYAFAWIVHLHGMIKTFASG